MEQNKIRSRLVYVLVLLLGISVVSTFYLYQKYANSPSFASGVEIGGIPVQGCDQEKAIAAVNQGITEFYATTVTFYKDDYSYESKLGDLCLIIDAGNIVQSVWQEEKSRSWLSKARNLTGREKIVYPVNIPYDPAKKAKILEEWDVRWSVPAKNATLEVDSRSGLIVVPGQTGTKVNGELSFNSLPLEMKKIAPFRVPIAIETVEPQINASMLQNMGELSSFSTYFNTSEINRSHNLQMAASSINKSVVAPNMVFSFNSAVGQRTMERGYRDAMVIVGNKFEPGLGGGICQVSSTLYNASLLAGLGIVERHNHNLSVAYVPLGRDATIAYGIQDLKFRNNTDHPIYIRAVTSGGKLTINIYGNLQSKQKIEIYNIIDKTLDFTTVFEQDPTLKPGDEKVDHKGQLGYVVRSFRSFYGNDGKIAKTEQLARDTYKPLNKLVLQGPKITPEPGTNTPGGENEPLPDPEKPVTPRPPDNSNQNGSDETPLNEPIIQP